MDMTEIVENAHKKLESGEIETLPAPPKPKYVPFNPFGRPARYRSAKQMQTKILEYFNQDWTGMKPTITGLTLFLGFCDRTAFHAYEQKPEFSNTLKAARSLIARVYENKLHNPQCTGSIFALKNLGWNEGNENQENTDNNQPKQVFQTQINNYFHQQGLNVSEVKQISSELPGFEVKKQESTPDPSSGA